MSSETDITFKVLTLVFEKLYDDYSLEQGDKLDIVKTDGLGKIVNYRYDSKEERIVNVP